MKSSFIAILTLLISMQQLDLLAQNKKQAENKQPNIIFITSDSHRAEALGINGNKFVKTPNLDNMVKNGVQYKNAYTTTAICVVSRASILSGQHVKRHKINNFSQSFSQEAIQKTYPIMLKKAGYNIAQIGFLGVGKNEFDKDFNHYETSIPWMTKNGLHQNDNIAEKSVAYINSQNKDKPFYLAVSFEAAHEIDGKNGKPATYLIQDRFKTLYEKITMPIPKTGSASYFETLPDFLRADNNISRQRWFGFFSTPELHQENSKNYYRLITGIDEAVGKIIQGLKESGLDKNTVIIYTSDHGFSLGEHGFMGKWTAFEQAIHVPMIIYDLRPNSKFKKKTTDKIALNIDLAPTMLHLAGIVPDTQMQGINMLDLLNSKVKPREHFFYEHSIMGSPGLPKIEAIVSKRYKYINYIEHNYEMLFDLKKDPDESKNLIKDPSYAKILKQLKANYEQERMAAN